MSDIIASMKWRLKNIDFWQDTMQVVRISAGLVIQSIQKVYQFFLKYNVIVMFFNAVSSTISYIMITISQVLRFPFIVVKSVILIVFAPFNLFIKILDYNSRQFINFWLLLLFDTKIEKIITLENGLIHLEILSEWIRFVNVMCITALVLGGLTYYTLIRTIYWLTKLDNKKKQKNKRLSSFNHAIAGASGMTNINSSSLVNEGSSILQEYLAQEELKQRKQRLEEPNPSSFNIKKNDRISIDPETDANSTSSTSTVETLNYNRVLPEEDEEDDIGNYGSLGQLSSKTTPISSPLVSSTSIHLQSSTPLVKTNSTITTAFRSRLANSRSSSFSSSGNAAHSADESPVSTVRTSEPSTLTSNIFTINRPPPQTPITTIEEDDEEDGEEKH